MNNWYARMSIKSISLLDVSYVLHVSAVNSHRQAIINSKMHLRSLLDCVPQ
jgi:hypothetical protein